MIAYFVLLPFIEVEFPVRGSANRLTIRIGKYYV